MLSWIALYLVVVFMIPLCLSAIVGLRSLPSGRRCPVCAGETVPLISRLLAPFRHGQLTILEKRWCMECGWEGVSRRIRTQEPDRALPQRALPSYRYDAGFTETLDVRSITIEGRTWRVLLQCWTQTKQCYGRLVFVEPTGRLWADATEAFSGETRFEVIGQAFTAPDGMLTSRLMRILSEA